MTTNSKPATADELVEVGAITAGTAMYQACAIACALAEAKLVDPMKIAQWAETMAAISTSNKDHQAVSLAIAERLREFAGVLRSMATKPAGSGQMRQ